MTRHVAFLRGVNLGKRQTKSADLTRAFESIGLSGVKTLIASGNVLFDSTSNVDLTRKIEQVLAEQFGFDIGVVLRSLEDLVAMVASSPFKTLPPDIDVARHVLLFAEPMKAPLPKLDDVAGDYEVARIDPLAIYFVVHRKPDGTYLGNSALGTIDKLLPKGHTVTMRNWNTIEKAAAR